MSCTMTQACGETDKDAPVVMESPLRSGAPPERERSEPPGFSSAVVLHATRSRYGTITFRIVCRMALNGFFSII